MTLQIRPVGKHIQEGRHALGRRLAAEEKHLILSQRDLARDQGQEPAFEVGKLMQNGLEAVGLKAADGTPRHSLRRVGVPTGHGEPEEIAGEEKSDRLLAAIGKLLVDPYAAPVENIAIPRWVSLPKDRFVTFELMELDDPFKLVELISIEGSGKTEGQSCRHTTWILGRHRNCHGIVSSVGSIVREFEAMPPSRSPSTQLARGYAVRCWAGRSPVFRDERRDLCHDVQRDHDGLFMALRQAATHLLKAEPASLPVDRYQSSVMPAL